MESVFDLKNNVFLSALVRAEEADSEVQTLHVERVGSLSIS